MTRHPILGKKPTYPTGRLRILQTTDLHMHILPYDYFSNRPDNSIGLIRLVDTISRLRLQPDVTTLLCDNGDTLQGNPLADFLAQQIDDTAMHPMIAALNMLDYDAMTLGNHEFDYGLAFLRNALKDADFPIVSANIRSKTPPMLANPFAILDRQIACDDGVTRLIKIGITGFSPPQVADWDHNKHRDAVEADDIVDAAQHIVPQMKAAGADLIIALCHAGIADVAHTPRMENAAIPLAGVDGIDVILAGHTHETFPDPNGMLRPNVDLVNGALHEKPAVMASFYGKALGIVDLSISCTQGKWQINDHAVHLERRSSPKLANGPLQNALAELIAVPHAATLAQTQQHIASTEIPIHSYFATIQPDLSQQLLARATQQAVQTAMRDTVHAGIPVLAAKSPFRSGGRGGLGHYIDIPAGPVTLRDAAAIFPFADRLCAVRRTGAQIAQWLERSASHYNQIKPGTHETPLINPLSASYNCDSILGLCYEIDLTQPARFDLNGHQVAPQAQRIKQLTHAGKQVRDDDVFIVATNSFRTNGGGGFAQPDPSDILQTSIATTRDIFISYLQTVGRITEPVGAIWSFAHIPDTSAIFQSAPAAKARLARDMSHIGPGEGGFHNYRIRF